MFSIDDRTGNVVTTVALFLVAAATLYLARRTFFILLLSLLFAYLLEPAVTFVQEHSCLSRQNRTRAIAQVTLPEQQTAPYPHTGHKRHLRNKSFVHSREVL